MLGILCAIVAGISVLIYVVIGPVIKYFHDPKGLRRYQNLDLLAGITNLSFMIEAHKGFRSKRLLELHSKGSPVIRIGPNSLSYGVVGAIKNIYGHSTSLTKSGEYNAAAGTHFHLADVVDKKDHARKRKVLSSAFASKNLEEWEYKVASKVEQLQAQFDKHCKLTPNELIDYRMWTNYFTIDTLVDISLSEQTSCLYDGKDRVVAESIDGSTWEVPFRDCLYGIFHAQSGLVWAYDWFKTLVTVTNLVSPQYNRLWKCSKGWGGIVNHLARKRWDRYKKGEKVDDLFQSLMEGKDGDPHNLEWGEIVAEIGLMISGSSSVSNAIANTMFQLLKTPDCMQKLQQEVDMVLDVNDIVAPYDKAKHLPYLRACLDESLRMYPPISHGLPRETPPGGAQILGEWIPGKTTVPISAFVAHRDPSVYLEPEVFNPSRWLGDEGKQLQPFFIAFSAGARGCIGPPITYLQQVTLLASLVHRYNFELVSSEWKPDRRETMNLILGPVPVKIKRRKPTE